MEQNKINTISIAAIHATILTILIGFVTAYSIFKQTRIAELENKVISQAEKINLVQYEFTIYFPSDQIAELDTIQSIEKYAAEIRDYFGIPSFHPFEIDKSGKIFLSSKKSNLEEKAQEARKALALMNIIFHYHPFPKSYWKLEGKRGWDVSSPIEYVYFQNVEEVNRWLEKVKRVNNSFSYIFGILKMANYNSESILALYEVEKKKWQDIGTLPINLGKPSNPFSKLKNYFSNYQFVREIIKDTEYSLNRLGKQKKDFPKFTLLLLISFIFLNFIVGVFLPIIKPDISGLFFIWLPFVFYLTAFIFVFFKIVKI